MVCFRSFPEFTPSISFTLTTSHFYIVSWKFTCLLYYLFKFSENMFFKYLITGFYLLIVSMFYFVLVKMCELYNKIWLYNTCKYFNVSKTGIMLNNFVWICLSVVKIYLLESHPKVSNIIPDDQKNIWICNEMLLYCGC